MRLSSWRRRTSQNAIIVDRVVSAVTVTDPQHSLFGQRLALANERSGRGPAYVVVRLPDGRRRSIQITATDLTADCSACARIAERSRISIRTLIPLAQHLDRILNLLTEEVIRDEPANPSVSSRCVSTTDAGRREHAALGVRPASMAEPVATDPSSGRPNISGTVAPDAADAGGARKGNVPC